MNDVEFYNNLDELVKQLIKGVPHIVCDIGLLNEVCIEITKRRKKCSNENN